MYPLGTEKPLTNPEPAQAEVGANDSNVEAVRFDQNVKKYRLEFSANRIDESWSDGFERYCLLAIQESTATLRAELAKAKASARQCADGLGILRGTTPFKNWENGEGESIDALLEAAYQSASAIAASKE